MSDKRKFNLRAAITLMVSLTFITIAGSGLILYFSPRGPGAIIGLNKGQWENLHVMMGVVFMAVALGHVAYNLRPLWKYVRMPFEQGLKRSRGEMVAAIAVTLVVLLGTVYAVPPFSLLGHHFGQGPGGPEGHRPPPGMFVPGGAPPERGGMEGNRPGAEERPMRAPEATE